MAATAVPVPVPVPALAPSSINGGYPPISATVTAPPGYGYYGAAAPVATTHQPMVPDPRLAASGVAAAAAAVPATATAAAGYDYYGGGYPPQQQQQQHLEIPGYRSPAAQPAPASVPDLFSLLPSGALTAAAKRPLDPRGQAGGPTTARLGLGSKRGKPPSLEFSNERIKVDIHTTFNKNNLFIIFWTTPLLSVDFYVYFILICLCFKSKDRKNQEKQRQQQEEYINLTQYTN
jgi:hypothetical protein